MPKRESDGSIAFKSYRAGEVEMRRDSFIFRTDRNRVAAARAVDGGGGGREQTPQIDIMA